MVKQLLEFGLFDEIFSNANIEQGISNIEHRSGMQGMRKRMIKEYETAKSKGDKAY
jgi:hypothetical protein